MSDLTSPSGQRFLEMLPAFYETIRDFCLLMQAEGVEFDDLASAAESNLSEVFLETATTTILRWEREFGIVPEISKPIDQRRSAVLSKIRGYGTATAALVKKVAESFEHGEVAVSVKSAEYKVTISFVSEFGIPPNIADIQKAINDVIPAHLATEYVFLYLWWGLLDSAEMPWSEFDALDLDWSEFEVWKPT